MGSHLSTVQWLLGYGPDPRTGIDGETIYIVQRAAASGSLEVFETILEAQRAADNEVNLNLIISFGASCSKVGLLNLGLKSAELPDFDDFAKNQQLADEQVAEVDRGLWNAVAANSRDCLYFLLSFLTSHYHDGSFPYYQCKEKLSRSKSSTRLYSPWKKTIQNGSRLIRTCFSATSIRSSPQIQTPKQSNENGYIAVSLQVLVLELSR